MRFPILVSYAYARQNARLFREYVDNPDVELLLDSGAFTAANTGEEIRLDEYCKFLDQLADYNNVRYMALDVVGDPAGTDANLKEMLRAGYSPVPVHVLGDDKRRMDELFEMSDYVALAGLKRPGRGHAPKSYTRLKMQWAAGRKVHWLGYVVESMFRRYRPYSVDSSSWTYGNRYGWAFFYAGNGRWLKPVQYKSRHLLKPHADFIASELNRLGYTLEQFNDPDYWFSKDRRVSIQAIVNQDSWFRYVLDVYRNCGVRVMPATTLATCDYLRELIKHNPDRIRNTTPKHRQSDGRRASRSH